MQNNKHTNLPSQVFFKRYAKLIRAILGSKTKHSQALNLLSMQYGYNNWHICKSKIPQHTEHPTIEEVVDEGDMEDIMLEYTMNVLRGYEPVDKNININKEDLDKDGAYTLKFIKNHPELWNKYLKRFYKEHNIVSSSQRGFMTLTDDTHETIYDMDITLTKVLGKIVIATLKAFSDKPGELAKHDIYKLNKNGERVQDFSSDFWRKGRINPSFFLDIANSNKDDMNTKL